MKWVTHQSIGVMAAYSIGMPLFGVAAAWFGSIFPDVLDQKRAALSFNRQKSFNRHHRGTTHWFGWWLALFAFSDMSYIPHEHLSTLLAGFAFGAFTHVVLDMCTVNGVPMSPTGSMKFSFKICKTGSFIEYAILGIAALGFFLWKHNELAHLDFTLI